MKKEGKEAKTNYWSVLTQSVVAGVLGVGKESGWPADGPFSRR